MYFLYTLLQSLDRDAYLDDLDSINELRVNGIEVATQMVTADKVFQVIQGFIINNELIGTENRSLWHLKVNSIGLESLRTLLK